MSDDPPDLTVLSDREAASLAAVLGLLGDPTRLRIVLLLCRGERNVTRLTALLGLPQPSVSHHLALLRSGGLVTARRDGRTIHYALGRGLAVVDGGCALRVPNASGVTVQIVAGPA